MNKKYILISLFLLSVKSTHAGLFSFLRSFTRQAWNTYIPHSPINHHQVEVYCNYITDKKLTPLEKTIQCMEKTCLASLKEENSKKTCKEFTTFLTEISKKRIEQQRKDMRKE